MAKEITCNLTEREIKNLHKLAAEWNISINNVFNKFLEEFTSGSFTSGTGSKY